MKQVVFTLVVLFSLLKPAAAQNENNFIPELVFKNPVLVSGTAGKDGAVYKFSNVAAGIDATVKIAARSSSSVTLTDIDVTETGWNKAFQPQLGIKGNVPCYQNWWMDFEMRFYKAGTNNKQKIKGFSVTAIDVDGDGVSIQEYLQMNKAAAVEYCPVNYLAPQGAAAIECTYDNQGYNTTGTDRKVLGPVRNFTNIDTSGTPVMATFTYNDKDMIVFRYGAKSGNIVSNAGERLNSLWFKAFNLTPPALLPIRFASFTATYAKGKATLNWTAQADDIPGHFAVERSTDGSNFEQVGQRLATEGTHAYSFTDDNLPATAAVVYYRIQSQEKSGERNFSSVKVIRVNKDAAAALAVHPNPVRYAANLTLPASWQAQPVQISVYNSAGNEVFRSFVKAASQTETIALGQLPQGFYVVKAVCNGQWSEERIIKN